MPRSSWKGLFCDLDVMAGVRAMQMAGGAKVQTSAMKIMSRSSAILPEFVGYRFDVHNGKKFFPIQIKENMVGKKFGEFAPTRTYPKHPEKVAIGTGPGSKK